MTRKSPILVLGPMCLLLLLGCAARRWTPPETPNDRSERPRFSNVRIELQGFAAPGADPNTNEQLRRDFLGYIRSRGEFDVLVDAPWVWSSLPSRGSPGTLVLDARVSTDHTAWRTYLFDVLGVVGWPLVPQWGTARAELSVQAFGPSGDVVWTKTVAGEAPYVIWLYSWFRTEPVEEAYRDAVGAAFDAAADDLVKHGDEILEQIGVTRVASRPARLHDARGWVIAVLDSRADGVDDALVERLTDQVRVELAGRGVRVIDRGRQRDVLRALLIELKLESHAVCYDESCQIPLGKALAASHVLTSHVSRFGRTCVLSSEVTEVAAEVAVAAASVRADCSEEGFLESTRTLVRLLLRS